MPTIGNAPLGEDSSIDESEKFPVSGSKWMSLATVVEYIRTKAQTLTNKTLTTPTIASFANAQHNHADAAGGGSVSGGAGIPADGWVDAGATWTRTGNHTFTISGDVTAVYRKGTKVRYRDGGSDEYGVVGSSTYSNPNTTVTLITNTDYTMAAATITDNYYSHIENPQGFPDFFNWNANPQGFSVVPPSPVYRWRVSGKEITLHYLEPNNGTSNATTFTATAPIAPVYLTGAVLSTAVDNGTVNTGAGRVTMTAGSDTLTFRTNMATGAWTGGSTGKRAVMVIAYEF